MDTGRHTQLATVANTLRNGGVIAYPTEAVYGLGCDPFNLDAVTKIIQIKHRSIKKGFILIAASWAQLEPLVLPIEPAALTRVQASWPGPVTWVFPASSDVPMWIRGDHSGIAIRVTNHPIAKKICEYFCGPIISTSANMEGFPPARDERTLRMTMENQIDYIISGKVGGHKQPTEMRNAITGDVLRKA